MDENDIVRDITLAENDIDREGQQQDKKNHICFYSQYLSLLLQRHPLFCKNYIDRDISVAEDDIDREDQQQNKNTNFFLH